MSVNKVVLLGRLGKDPETNKTPSGVSVATFSIATSEYWKDKEGKKQESTEWHRIVAWGPLAENVSKYCKKGSQVFIEGKLATRSWEDKEGVKRYTTEVIAANVQFLDSRSDGGADKPPVQDPPPYVNTNPKGSDPEPGEIPF